MMLIGQLELPRYRVDTYKPNEAHIEYFGPSIAEAKTSLNNAFRRLIDSNYEYKAEIIIYDNYYNKTVEKRYYPDDVV